MHVVSFHSDVVFGDFFHPETHGNSTTKMRSIFQSGWNQQPGWICFVAPMKGFEIFTAIDFHEWNHHPKFACFVCFSHFSNKVKKQRKITYLPIPNRLFVCLFVCLLIFLLFKWPLGLRTWTPTKELKQLGWCWSQWECKPFTKKSWLSQWLTFKLSGITYLSRKK